MNNGNISLGEHFKNPDLRPIVSKPAFDNYDNFCDGVEVAVLRAMNEMEDNRDNLQKLDEDGISTFINVCLKKEGFHSGLGQELSGACDLVVTWHADTGNSYTWRGEAKIHKGHEYIYGGYLQLSTRYANPKPSADYRGGMLIYLKNKNGVYLPEIVEDWRVNLIPIADSSKKIKINEVSDLCTETITFTSTHLDPRKGCNMLIRHITADLRYDPKDPAADKRKKNEGD